MAVLLQPLTVLSALIPSRSVLLRTLVLRPFHVWLSRLLPLLMRPLVLGTSHLQPSFCDCLCCGRSCCNR